MICSLADRIAIVTGAAQGLGEAIARRLAQEGAHVTLADINLEGVRRTTEAIAQETGRRTLAVQCDVTDEAQVDAMVQRTVETFGRLDILVANAGILIAGD
ncbi:MAG TPA: SDR family NAD(P)-dependent oxidoreductase, partial [Anaerolineae bacterium]|nr:SDR family NAD(P)-dependent oxidoreductase [Anaerolineae bacterium]